MLQIIIIIIVIAVVWSILKAIFSGIAEFIKEHPKGTVTFLFVAAIGGLSVYGYYIGEFSVEEVIAAFIGSFIFIKVCILILTIILKIFFAIRRSMIISGIDNYFRCVSRTISYSKLTSELNSRYGKKKLKLDGSEYSDSYIDTKVKAFVNENQQIVSNSVIDMVNKSGMTDKEQVFSTVGAYYRNYCVGSSGFESFVVSTLDNNFKSMSSSDGNTIYRIEGAAFGETLKTSSGNEDYGISFDDEDF